MSSIALGPQAQVLVSRIVEEGTVARVTDAFHALTVADKQRICASLKEMGFEEQADALSPPAPRAAASASAAGKACVVPAIARAVVGDVPDCFLCPITYTLLVDPVIGSDGHTYSRAAITAWLQKKPTSPMTQQPMKLNDLRPNRAVGDIIEFWKNHGFQNHVAQAAAAAPRLPSAAVSSTPWSGYA